jgi:arylsulfatase A-like enzyme
MVVPLPSHNFHARADSAANGGTSKSLRSRLLPLLAATVLLGTGGCSRDSDPAPGASGEFALDLLAHGPDEVLAELGSASTPGEVRSSGLLSGGWNTADSDGGPLPSTGGQANLALRLARKRDLRLELTLRSDQPGPIEVEVNGSTLPKPLQVDRDARSIALDLAAASLRRGRNRLTLRRPGIAPDEAQGTTGEAPELNVELSGLAWGRTELAEVSADQGQLRLGPGGAVKYRLELHDFATLDLAGSATAAGDLLVELAMVDPLTGFVRGRGELNELELASGRWEQSLSLTPPPGGLAELWISVPHTADVEEVRIEHAVLTVQDRVRPPSILFLSIDTLSAQNMGLYGYERDTTPELAAFAEDAVVFERARSNAPWTVPSYVSQITGQFPHANEPGWGGSGGDAKAYELFTVPDNRWTLPEMLRGAGYRTVGLPDNHWLPLVQGFSQGFEVFDVEAAEREHPTDLAGGMHTVFPKALEHLSAAKRDSRPLFLFAQIFDVHGPYVPTGEYDGRYSADAALSERLLVVPDQPSIYGTVPAGAFPELWTDPEALPKTFDPEILRARYDEKILEFDAALGEFFDELEDLGLDDLVVVLSADHGESMGDHDFAFRHGQVYDDVLHVPLLVRMPRGEREGARVTTPVQLVDLYPTFAELAGLPTDRGYLHGQSLAGFLGRGPEPEALPLLATGNFQNQVMVGFDRWKVVSTERFRGADHTRLSSRGNLELLAEHRGDELARILGEDWQDLDRNAFHERLVERVSEISKQEFPDMYSMRRYLMALPPAVEVFDTSADSREQENLAKEQLDLITDAKVQLEIFYSQIRASHSLAVFEEGGAPPSAEDLEQLSRLGYLVKDE